MVTEGKDEIEKKVVLTSPLSLDGDSDDADYRAPNLIQRILGLLKNVRPGSDLTRFQLPPLFNIPKSHLQCYGESVYCFGNDILKQCSNGTSSVDRLTSVVAWNISTLRPVPFGVAPYNPILGETHHVSAGNLNVLLEQVSHHPPVSALHATDELLDVEIIWCQHPVPKFYGTSIETEVHGKRQLKLLKHGETYVMNSPKLLIKLFPVPSVDWVGNVKIHCIETCLEAELCYRTNSFLGRRANYRSLKGKIFESSSSKTVYEIDGHWDSTVSMKNIKDGKSRIIYNAKETISGLKIPIVNDSKGVWPSESAVVWSEVSRGILCKDWEKAREAKQKIEANERELVKQRSSNAINWVPRHFKLSCIKDFGWECEPFLKSVPIAPMIVPCANNTFECEHI